MAIVNVDAYDEPVGVALLFDADELWIFNRSDDLHVDARQLAPATSFASNSPPGY